MYRLTGLDAGHLMTKRSESSSKGCGVWGMNLMIGKKKHCCAYAQEQQE